MQIDESLFKEIKSASTDVEKADELIRRYLPFIRSEASKACYRVCTDQDDELSIAMMAFYEALLGFDEERGSFFSYASMLIKNRIIDHYRSESRYQGHISIYEPGSEDGRELIDELADKRDPIDDSIGLEATRQEIEELGKILSGFDVSFSDVADNCPRQERTLRACSAAISYGSQDEELLAELLRTRRLPIRKLSEGSGVERKTLERHRRYLIAMLLIYTNGSEIIRGHLRHRKGGDL